MRRLENWVDSFSEYAAVFNAPERYRRWAALWTIGTAAKRSIASRGRGGMLGLNMFILLLGGPSTGKSRAIEAVKSVLSPATKFKYIPPSVTRAGMEDYMQANMQLRTAPDARRIASNECIGISEEMQGILPDQDLGHLTLYNELFELRNSFTAQTRTHGELRLESPYCSILTGAQPAFLATTLPEQAWGMGFMSRSIIIWDTPPQRRSYFEDSLIDYKLQEDLISDLRLIFEQHGWMKWTAPAMALYDEWWVKHGGEPIPKHKRLAMGYNGRRELQILKLSMIFSLAMGDDLIVTETHVAAAIRQLLEAESQMQHIFNEMSSTGSMVAIEDIMDVVRTRSAAGEETHEAQIIELMMQRFPSTQVHSMVENMIASKMLEVSGNSAIRGMRKFKIGKGAGVTI